MMENPAADVKFKRSKAFWKSSRGKSDAKAEEKLPEESDAKVNEKLPESEDRNIESTLEEAPEEKAPEERAPEELELELEGDEIALDDIALGDLSLRGEDPTQPRAKVAERRSKRRPEGIEAPRLRKVFEPQPVIELLRGRYRAVSKEMRLSKFGSDSIQDVYRYEPEDELSPAEEPDVDFESMMQDAVDEFARGRRKVPFARPKRHQR